MIAFNWIEQFKFQMLACSMLTIVCWLVIPAKANVKEAAQHDLTP